VEAAGRALEALGVRGESIGLDTGGLSPDAWERARGRLGGPGVANGTTALLVARRVKAPFEIECLERALRIAEEALNEVIQVLARGTTEREAAAACRAEMVKRGAEPARVLVAVGERSGMPLAWPTDRALRAGEVIRFDVGCAYRGYHARVARTAVLGEPTAEHDVACGVIEAGLEAAIEGARPGRAAGAVFAAAAEAIRAHDPAKVRRPAVGHGVGLEARELPVLSPDDPTPLEAGEVLQLEMSHFQVGAFGCALAETVLVTTAGARVLNRSARGLVTLD
jgi:Xaa-Pro aminopeptidase